MSYTQIDQEQSARTEQGFALPENGGRREPETKEQREQGRPDVLASGKWHDQALDEYPESSFFQTAKINHTGIVNSLDMLEVMAKQRDPRKTPAAHAEEVTKQAESVSRRLESRIEATVTANRKQLDSIEEITRDFLGLSKDDPHGQEIRARLSAMTDDQRRAAITQAAADGDHHVMAAVLHGPAFLVGVSKEEKARMVEGYKRRHASHMVAEYEAHQRSAEKLEAAYREGVAFIRQHFIDRSANPDIERANEAQRRYESVLANL